MVITAQDTKLKPGFKQTEVGVIPVDWEISSLETFISFISYGFTNPMPSVENGVYMITAKDINHGKIQFDTARCTSEEAYQTLLTAKSRPKKDDLLLTKDGTLGRLALVDNRKVCINQSVAVLRLNSKIVPKFLKVLLEAPIYQNRMLEEAGGSTIKHIYITIVNRMPVAVPSTIDEQNAIANVLSDTEDLIERLEELITKKRDIKQATMQRLLTGKTGLSGFAGDGGARLGDFFELNPNKSYLRDTDLVTFIRMEDVSENGRIINQNIMPLSSIKKGLTYFERNDVLVAKITPCFENGKGAYLDRLETKCGFGSTEFHVLRAKKNASPRYIFYQTQLPEFRNRLEAEMIGTAGQKRVPARTIINYPLPIYHSRDEQIAIATVLSDIDAEIAALEQRRDKTHALKQGMMQELLTGKTRLV